jgi:hypothetical protein
MTAPIEMTLAVAAADPDAVLAGISGQEIEGCSLGQIAWVARRAGCGDPVISGMQPNVNEYRRRFTA